MRYLLLCAFIFSFLSSEAEEGRLSQKELDEVTEVTDFYLSESTLTPLAKLLYGVYLANAQRDFAWQSKAETGSFEGSFIPVTLGIWELFQPKTLLSELENKPVDPESQKRAEPIVARYKERLLKEGAKIKNSAYQKGPGLWTAYAPPYGLNFASITPWSLKTSSEFRSKEPALQAVYQQEATQIKKQMATLDIKKLSAIDYWTNQADFVKKAAKYMAKQNIPLEIRLDVRAALYSAIVDATAAAFDSKYTYFMPRPSSFDEAIMPVIEVPSHPSYPSHTSAVTKAVAVVLGGYFPANKEKWDVEAQQAGLSKVAAGVHFMVDHEAGRRMGEQVGEATLRVYKK